MSFIYNIIKNQVNMIRQREREREREREERESERESEREREREKKCPLCVFVLYGRAYTSLPYSHTGMTGARQGFTQCVC